MNMKLIKVSIEALIQLTIYLMIYKIKILLTIIIVFLINQKISFAKENKILFKIDNEIVTTYDILQQIEYLNILNPYFSKLNYEEKYEISKNEIINQQIKKIELKKIVKEFKVDDKSIESALVPLLNQLNIKNLKQFEIYLNNRPINIRTIKKKIIIEILWNELIFLKYSKNVKIDKEKLIQTIKNKKIEKNKTYLLSEIIFNPKTKSDYNDQYKLIKSVINDEGFEKAALKFSISDSSKNGGKVGWINENGLNEKIRKSLSKVKINYNTNPIKIPNGFLILKINDVKEEPIEIDSEKELEKLIRFKTDEQLKQFSIIFFNKLKKEIKINEL